MIGEIRMYDSMGRRIAFSELQVYWGYTDSSMAPFPTSK